MKICRIFAVNLLFCCLKLNTYGTVSYPPPTKSGVSGLRRRLQRLMLVLAAVAGMANVAQAQYIEINDTNFPDVNFRTHVKQYDTDSDGSLSDKEIAAVTSIDVSTQTITDLKGIEHFTALTELSCGSDQLTTLDVSANTALKKLYCSYGQLTTLDVSNCTALTDLFCHNNQLSTLDVSNCTALQYLECYSNHLNALDVSKNTELKKLDCSSNQLTALNVANCTALTHLDCYSNQIKGDEMLALVNSLPHVVLSGYFCVVSDYNNSDGNVITKSQVAIAKRKWWDVCVSWGTSYDGLEEYALTLNVTGGGTLTATPNGNITEGTEVTLTATPDEGYKFKTLKAYKTGDESQTVAISENKFTMPAYDVTVEAEFEAITYTLTYAAGAGGTIQGSATQTVAHGQSGTEVEAKPNEGYKFVKWSDGRTTAKRTDSNVQRDSSVTAIFELIPTYTLTYTAGEGGSIKGNNTQTVREGQSGTEMEAVANEGYKFVKWSDGRTTAKRTDSNVQGNLSVTAEFEKSSTTGLFDIQLDALSVYPNPTQGVLWVSVPELAEGTAAEVLVYNAAGQLLQRVAARAASTGSAASRLSIDLSGYPTGVYIISVGNAVAKVVKQ